MKLPMFRRFGAAAGVVLLAASTVAQATTTPTQGSLGSTSTGIVNLSATVQSKVQISGLSDVAFTNPDPANPAQVAQSVCVFSNTATKGYNVKATGTSSAFTLANAALTVPYTVEWASSTGQSSGTGLTAGTALTGLLSTATTPSCSGGTDATLIVKMSAAALQSMQSNTSYTGTLTLLVGPE